MKNHRCERFTQIGMLQLFAGSLVTVDGQVRHQSEVKADTVHVSCIKCGAEYWLERASVERVGKQLRLKVQKICKTPAS